MRACFGQLPGAVQSRLMSSIRIYSHSNKMDTPKRLNKRGIADLLGWSTVRDSVYENALVREFLVDCDEKTELKEKEKGGIG